MKKKRTLCCRPDCEERWEIRVEVLVGDTKGSQYLKGKFCVPHAKAAKDTYRAYLSESLEHEISLRESP